MIWKRCVKHRVIFCDHDKCLGCQKGQPASYYVVLSEEEFKWYDRWLVRGRLRTRSRHTVQPIPPKVSDPIFFGKFDFLKGMG